MSSPAPAHLSCSSPCRYGGFDWLRVLACLLVVTFHAGIPYMSSPLPSLVWAADDQGARSHVIDGVSWAADTFMMPVFFLMGGFLACHSCGKMTASAFVRQRSARLGMPLLISFLLVLPGVALVWIFGWICQGELTPQQLSRGQLKPAQWAQLRCWGHLWFLVDLWLFSLAAAVAVAFRRRAASRSDEAATLRLPRATRSRGPLGRLAVVAALLAISIYGLYWEPRTVIGFKSHYLPRLPHILYYAPCFLLGWLLHAWKWSPGRATPAALLIGAALLFPGLWGMIARHVVTPFTGIDLVWLVATFTTCGWMAAGGLFAWALRYQGSVPRPIAYLSRASLWIYLAHLPPVALFQVSFRAIPGHGFLKAVATGGLSLAYVLAVYELTVRGQRLDTLLHGAGSKPAEPPALDTAAATESDRLKSAA